MAFRVGEMLRLALSCVVLMVMMVVANGHIHNLTLKSDTRRSVLVETFGFAEGGFQRIRNTAVEVGKVRR